MEETSAQEPVQAEGVTENSQTPQTEPQVESQPEGVEEGRIPMSRWNAKLKAERELKAQVQDLQGRFSKYQQAIEFHDWLSQDPNRFQKVMNVLQEKAEAQAQEDPYKDWDPVVASKFREQDALKQKLAEIEQKEQLREVESRTAQQQSIDDAFNARLQKDGYIGKDGNGDPQILETLEDLVRAELGRTSKTPDRPTHDEFSRAYDSVTSRLSVVEKIALKKATVKTSAPLSGSNRGMIPSGKKSLSDEERIAAIAASL